MYQLAVCRMIFLKTLMLMIFLQKQWFDIAVKLQAPVRVDLRNCIEDLDKLSPKQVREYLDYRYNSTTIVDNLCVAIEDYIDVYVFNSLYDALCEVADTLGKRQWNYNDLNKDALRIFQQSAKQLKVQIKSSQSYNAFEKAINHMFE